MGTVRLVHRRTGSVVVVPEEKAANLANIGLFPEGGKAAKKTAAKKAPAKKTASKKAAGGNAVSTSDLGVGESK